MINIGEKIRMPLSSAQEVKWSDPRPVMLFRNYKNNDSNFDIVNSYTEKNHDDVDVLIAPKPTHPFGDIHRKQHADLSTTAEAGQCGVTTPSATRTTLAAVVPTTGGSSLRAATAPMAANVAAKARQTGTRHIASSVTKATPGVVSMPGSTSINTVLPLLASRGAPRLVSMPNSQARRVPQEVVSMHGGSNLVIKPVGRVPQGSQSMPRDNNLNTLYASRGAPTLVPSTNLNTPQARTISQEIASMRVDSSLATISASEVHKGLVSLAKGTNLNNLHTSRESQVIQASKARQGLVSMSKGTNYNVLARRGIQGVAPMQRGNDLGALSPSQVGKGLVSMAKGTSLNTVQGSRGTRGMVSIQGNYNRGTVPASRGTQQVFSMHGGTNLVTLPPGMVNQGLSSVSMVANRSIYIPVVTVPGGNNQNTVSSRIENQGLVTVSSRTKLTTVPVGGIIPALVPMPSSNNINNGLSIGGSQGLVSLSSGTKLSTVSTSIITSGLVPKLGTRPDVVIPVGTVKPGGVNINTVPAHVTPSTVTGITPTGTVLRLIPVTTATTNTTPNNVQNITMSHNLAAQVTPVTSTSVSQHLQNVTLIRLPLMKNNLGSAPMSSSVPAVKYAPTQSVQAKAAIQTQTVQYVSPAGIVAQPTGKTTLPQTTKSITTSATSVTQEMTLPQTYCIASKGDKNYLVPMSIVKSDTSLSKSSPSEADKNSSSAPTQTQTPAAKTTDKDMRKELSLISAKIQAKSSKKRPSASISCSRNASQLPMFKRSFRKSRPAISFKNVSKTPLWELCKKKRQMATNKPKFRNEHKNANINSRKDRIDTQDVSKNTSKTGLRKKRKISRSMKRKLQQCKCCYIVLNNYYMRSKHVKVSRSRKAKYNCSEVCRTTFLNRYFETHKDLKAPHQIWRKIYDKKMELMREKGVTGADVEVRNGKCCISETDSVNKDHGVTSKTDSEIGRSNVNEFDGCSVKETAKSVATTSDAHSVKIPAFHHLLAPTTSSVPKTYVPRMIHVARPSLGVEETFITRDMQSKLLEKIQKVPISPSSIMSEVSNKSTQPTLASCSTGLKLPSSDSAGHIQKFMQVNMGTSTVLVPIGKVLQFADNKVNCVQAVSTSANTVPNVLSTSQHNQMINFLQQTHPLIKYPSESWQETNEHNPAHSTGITPQQTVQHTANKSCQIRTLPSDAAEHPIVKAALNPTVKTMLLDKCSKRAVSQAILQTMQTSQDNGIVQHVPTTNELSKSVIPIGQPVLAENVSTKDLSKKTICRRNSVPQDYNANFVDKAIPIINVSSTMNFSLVTSNVSLPSTSLNKGSARCSSTTSASTGLPVRSPVLPTKVNQITLVGPAGHTHTGKFLAIPLNHPLIKNNFSNKHNLPDVRSYVPNIASPRVVMPIHTPRASTVARMPIETLATPVHSQASRTGLATNGGSGGTSLAVNRVSSGTGMAMNIGPSNAGLIVNTGPSSACMAVNRGQNSAGRTVNREPNSAGLAVNSGTNITGLTQNMGPSSSSLAINRGPVCNATTAAQSASPSTTTTPAWAWNLNIKPEPQTEGYGDDPDPEPVAPSVSIKAEPTDRGYPDELLTVAEARNKRKRDSDVDEDTTLSKRFKSATADAEDRDSEFGIRIETQEETTENLSALGYKYNTVSSVGLYLQRSEVTGELTGHLNKVHSLKQKMKEKLELLEKMKKKSAN